MRVQHQGVKMTISQDRPSGGMVFAWSVESCFNDFLSEKVLFASFMSLDTNSMESSVKKKKKVVCDLWSLTSTAAMTLYDPRLCYILDCFLGLYGLIITGMFIKEKVGGPSVWCFLSPIIIKIIIIMIHLLRGFQFFTTKAKAADEPIYNVSHRRTHWVSV